jgi:hypothetical protein
VRRTATATTSSALDAIEALNPRAVIAEHKRAENDDSPRIIEETRQYIHDLDRIAELTTNARELYDKILEIYPDPVNPGALWSSARGVAIVLNADGIFGGPGEIRTHDLFHAMEARSQLRHRPIRFQYITQVR